jgi:hypothetical protein
MTPAPHWYHDNRVPTDLRRLLVRTRANPLVIVWRWRYEIALAAGLPIGLVTAFTSIGAVPTIVTVIAVTLIILSWPAVRRFIAERAWCIITPHRVRVGCAEGLIYSSRGKVPVILWTSHQAFGERVLLWCRAGTSVDDFVTARTVLATACWAQDVAVFFDTEHIHLVTLDVIRRSPAGLPSETEGHRSSGPSDRPSAWPGNQDDAS